MTEIDQLVGFLDHFLEVKKHGEDSGLKISGSSEVRKIGAAVDLSLYSIEKARAKGCDLLFTHHDAWSSTDADLVDRKQEMVRDSGLSLYISHDPLDKHSEVGTSVSLARTLGWQILSAFCADIGVVVEPPSSFTLDELARHVGATLASETSLIMTGSDVGLIGIVAGWGARPEWMAEARVKGASTFVSGEAIHFGKLYAQESGMNLVLAGHYATELPAVRALLRRIACEFDVETELIEDTLSAGL